MEYIQTFFDFIQKLVPIMVAGIVYKLTFPQKTFEARLGVKKDAFLMALNILDSQASYYFKNQGAILQQADIKDIRSTFSQLLICSDDPAIPTKFAEFFFPDKNISKTGDTHINLLNNFRNLIRKDLGLEKINFQSYPFENNSYFLYADCATENKNREHKASAKLK